MVLKVPAQSRYFHALTEDVAHTSRPLVLWTRFWGEGPEVGKTAFFAFEIMHIFSSLSDLRRHLAQASSVAFAPTMGNLHAGHIALMTAARRHADIVAASIFVNRLQFGPSEDFEQYPRTFEADCAKLEAAGVDVLFAPTEQDLYPAPQTYFVEPPAMRHLLEGNSRPGHFRGVATVVAKLFHCVQPQTALFGKKDYEQLMIVRAMVRQLAFPIDVVGIETVRAEDGLALSSRNGYLSAAERAEAPRLQRILQAICAQIREQRLERPEQLKALEEKAQAQLRENGWQPDYVAIRQQSDLHLPRGDGAPLVALAAARLGQTRLIDNAEV
jgi:pantoate--beta-alanine ligase